MANVSNGVKTGTTLQQTTSGKLAYFLLVAISEGRMALTSPTQVSRTKISLCEVETVFVFRSKHQT